MSSRLDEPLSSHSQYATTRVHELYARDPAARGLGIAIDSIEEGRVCLWMVVTDVMCNGHGIGHGGYVFALADTAAAYAFCSAGEAGVSTHSAIDYVSAARVGETLIAEARERHRSGKVGIYDVAVTSELGRPIAEFRMHGRVPSAGGAVAARPEAVVRTTLRDGVAHIAIDSPPVNCLSRPVRTGLLEALEAADRDDDVIAVVLSGAAGSFSAGADLAEFDNGEGLAEPTLHLTITGFLDAMTKPVVAAVDGVALGGGLELVLACHYRVATSDARLGLPETRLGFMPGAGGTQRLPRAVGVELAADLILSGRQLGGTQAHAAGLVDVVVDADVVAASHALALASACLTPLPRLRDRDIPDRATAEVVLESLTGATARGPMASPGGRFALEAIRSALGPFDSGLAHELALFEELAASATARAFRYQFLTDRRAGRAAGPRPADVTQAAVVGGGTMGRGITLALLEGGVATTLVETEGERLDEAVRAIRAELENEVARGRLTSSDLDSRLAMLSGDTTLDSLGQADVVIEAVFEDLELKQKLFAELDAVVGPDTILASNTSSLDLDAIAAAAGAPERVVGLHFFSPANKMRLVEVIDGRLTSPEVLSAAAGLVKQMGKIAVVARVGDGFIGNRMIDQYMRQALALALRGVPPGRVDVALEQWGMAMGPFKVLDLIGNDIPWQARRARYGADLAGGDEWALADEIYERGWLGRKCGRGWYDYPKRGVAVENPDLTEVLARRGKSATGTRVSDAEIVERCIYALVNEGAAVLADGIAASAGDIDVVLRHGYGFPVERGGPMFYADSVGLDRVVWSMRGFASEDPSFAPHPLLAASSDDGARISDFEAPATSRRYTFD
jgi:3-hydroxyacyl-CoA dehydrogenase